MPKRFPALILILLMASSMVPTDATQADPGAASPNNGSSGAMTSSSATPTQQENNAPLTAPEKKGLLSQFKKTLADEEKALDRQQKIDLKSFSNAQSQEVKDWRAQEKRTRRTYFDQHLSGPDRRTYVQNYITRKKDFDQKQRDDLASFKIALKEKHEVFKTAQKNRDTQFKAAIDRNERPAQGLWKP